MTEKDATLELIDIFWNEPIKDFNQDLAKRDDYQRIRNALEHKVRDLCNLEIKAFLPFAKEFLEECTCIEGLVHHAGGGHRAEPRLPASFVFELIDCFKIANLSKAQKLDLAILLRGSPEIDRILEDRKRCESLRVWPARFKLIEKSIKSS